MIIRFFIFVMLLALCDSARILGVFPTPSISHQVVFRKLTLELARRGHEVISITTDPVPLKDRHENLKEIDLHDISYKFWIEKFVPKMVGLDYDPVSFMDIFYKCTDELTEIQLSQPEVKEIISNRNLTFDLILYETIARAAIGIAHVFKAPLIALSSVAPLYDQAATVGFPSHPVLHPHILSLKATNHTLMDKIVAVFNDLLLEAMYVKQEWKDNVLMKKIFGDDCPNYKELTQRIDMSFIHENLVFDRRPMPPSVVYIGGIHLNPVKELPKDLKEYMDNSTNGIVYMSLGTNVMPSGLHPNIKTIFIKVLSSLPYDVILKWDNQELAGKFKNIMTTKWAPQNDLLRHPKVKLFINQGGLQSTYEALAAKVPLVSLPILADQFINADRYEQYGIGIRLVLDSLTEKDFRDAIEKVIGDKSYQANIARLGSQIEDQSQTPLERAVWWSEYVIRHKGAKHLRSAQANVSWYDFLIIDACLVLFLAFVGCLVLFFIVLNCIYKLFYGLSGNFVLSSYKKKD